MDRTKIGLIGCGNISDAYLRGAGLFDQINIEAVADLNQDAAIAKAETYAARALTVDQLLDDKSIEIIVNLTVPLVHAEVSQQIMEAGKHVYSEKPLAVTLSGGRALMAAAAAKGVRIGAAPDTFLGGGHQACRHTIDQGSIGDIIGGAASFLSHGMEHWHPNPTFFFKPGGGPVLDMAPYYLTSLVNMIGPVRRVISQTSTVFPQRQVTSEGPMNGQAIDVEVATSTHGILTFANGALVTVSLSWDVWQHDRQPIEIYGTEGSLLVPDPNFFGGEPRLGKGKGNWTPLAINDFAFGAVNLPSKSGSGVADYRIIGLLDMAIAIRQDRPHRANGDLALHVLEVMEALERSSAEDRAIEIESQVDRPDMLPKGEGAAVFL